MVKVDHRKYGEFCKKALEAAGLSKEAAESTEKYLLQTDMFGIRTHGTLNILPYIRKIEAGGIVKDAKPEVVKEGMSWAVIDGHNGMGYYNADYAMKIGMEKAKQTGISYIVIRNSSHYGACGVYSVEGAKEGFITITATNVGKTMTVPGGRGRIIGNAPFSYGVPQGDRHPSVFLDVATSNAAGMKVNRAKTAGQKVPDGWIVDETESRPMIRTPNGLCIRWADIRATEWHSSSKYCLPSSVEETFWIPQCGTRMLRPSVRTASSLSLSMRTS